MSVYIEYVIIDNFVLTYAICLVSYRALKTKTSTRRCILSALVGTFFAVIFPFLSLPPLALLLFRLVLGAVLSFILFHKKAKFLISTCVFLGTTFLFGGAFFAIGYMVHGDLKAALYLPIVDFPVGVLIVVTFVLYIVLKKLMIKFHKNRDIMSSVYEVEFDVLSKSFRVSGFCDTGNQIVDEVSGLPVAVLSFELTRQILPSDSMLKILLGKGEESYNDARYIEICPFASKPQKLWLIKPQKFILYFSDNRNIHIDVMLGLSLNAKKRLGYGVIFGSSVLPA